MDDKSQNAERITMEFGIGEIVVLGGKMGGAPTVALKRFRHGLNDGDALDGKVDFKLSRPEVGLRFFTKESMGTFINVLNKVYAQFDETKDDECFVRNYEVLLVTEGKNDKI